MKKMNGTQLVYCVITALLILATFLFSMQTSGASDGASLDVTRWLFSFVKPLITLIQNNSETQLLLMANQLVRKCAHFFIYFLLGFSTYLVFSGFYKRRVFVYASTLVFLFVAAAVDEIHQLFVDGRGAQITDVLIDMGGVVLALLIIMFCTTIKKGILHRGE